MINANNAAAKTAPTAIPALAPVDRLFDGVDVLFPVAVAAVVKLVGENEDMDSEPGADMMALFVVAAVVGCVPPLVVTAVVGLAELLKFWLVVEVLEAVDCAAV
jgi:hypothetical protein